MHYGPVFSQKEIDGFMSDSGFIKDTPPYDKEMKRRYLLVNDTVCCMGKKGEPQYREQSGNWVPLRASDYHADGTLIQSVQGELLLTQKVASG